MTRTAPAARTEADYAADYVAARVASRSTEVLAERDAAWARAQRIADRAARADIVLDEVALDEVARQQVLAAAAEVTVDAIATRPTEPGSDMVEVIEAVINPAQAVEWSCYSHRDVPVVEVAACWIRPEQPFDTLNGYTVTNGRTRVGFRRWAHTDGTLCDAPFGAHAWRSPRCPSCGVGGEPVVRQEAYGDTTTWACCGHSTYASIGD